MGNSQTAKRYVLGPNKREDGIKKAAWQLEDALQDRLPRQQRYGVPMPTLQGLKDEIDGARSVQDWVEQPSRFEDPKAKRKLWKTVYVYPSTPDARECHFETARAQQQGRTALMLLAVMSMFETPSWCNVQTQFWTWLDGHERCQVFDAPVDAKWLLSNVAYIPPGVGVVLEIYFLAKIARQQLLERKLQQWYFKPLGIEYINLKIVHFALICVVFELLDCIHFILFRPNYRLAFIARSLIMATLPAVQNLGGCVLAVLGELTTVVTCFFMTLLLFAWIAVTIFNTEEDFLSVVGVGNCGGSDIAGCVLTHEHKHINEGLDTLFSTFYTMFKAGTTDEFTDLFLPSFTMYRVTGLLWMAFLIIVHVLLLNLVLDTLVAAYTDNTEEEEETQVEQKVEGMKIAYETLVHTTGDAKTITDKRTKTQQQVLSKRSFLDFVQELGRSPHLRDIPESTASLIFDAIQTQDEEEESPSRAVLSHSASNLMLKEYVTLDKFCAMCAVIQYDFWTTEKDSPVRDMVGEGVWNSGWFTNLRNWVDCQEDEHGEKEETSKFDSMMNIVLMLNLVLVVLETAYDLRWIKKDADARALPQIELIFSFIYVFECGMKLCCWSWPEYTSDRSNTFDFCTTWLLLGSSVLEEIENAYADDGAKPGLHALRGQSVKGLKRYMNILRLLRLLRMVKTLKQWKKVQFMVTTMITLVKASVDILILLWVVIFFFTTLSVQLWGGLLYEGNSKLEGSEYAEKGFFVLNYNDFLTAFGAWVVSILCEYQSDFAEAVWMVTDKDLTWLVFPVFYLMGVCIVFELVKAFTIEVFLDLKKHEGESKEDEEFEGITTVQELVKQEGKALHFRPFGDQTVLEKLLKELKKLKPGAEHGHEHHEHHEEHAARPEEYEGLECSVQ